MSQPSLLLVHLPRALPGLSWWPSGVCFLVFHTQRLWTQKQTAIKSSGWHGFSTLDETRHISVFIYSSFLVIFFSKALPAPDVPFDRRKGWADREICSRAALKVERAHSVIPQDFNSNMRKAFYRRLKYNGSVGKREWKNGICSLVAQGYYRED